VKRTDPSVIIAGAERYAAYVARNAVADDKIKHPDGWLNAERWTDEVNASTEHGPKPPPGTPGAVVWDDNTRIAFEQWLPTPPRGLSGREHTQWMRDQRQRFIAERTGAAG